jgi:hypothetical protein
LTLPAFSLDFAFHFMKLAFNNPSLPLKNGGRCAELLKRLTFIPRYPIPVDNTGDTTDLEAAVFGADQQCHGDKYPHPYALCLLLPTVHRLPPFQWRFLVPGLCLTRPFPFSQM